MQVADGTTLFEPELFYLPFLRRTSAPSAEPVAHALPIRPVRGLSLGVRDRNAYRPLHVARKNTAS